MEKHDERMATVSGVTWNTLGAVLSVLLRGQRPVLVLGNRFVDGSDICRGMIVDLRHCIGVGLGDSGI